MLNPLIFFFLGFGVNVVSIAVLPFLLSAYLLQVWRNRFNASSIIYIFLYCLFFVGYAVAYERWSLSDPMGFGVGYFAFICLLFIAGLIFQSGDFESKIRAIIFLSIGALSQSLTVVLATVFFSDLTAPYYGRVFDYLSGGVGNSVMFANGVIYYMISYLLFIYGRQRDVWYTYKVLFFISAVVATVLVARTYFIVLVACLCYLVLVGRLRGRVLASALFFGFGLVYFSGADIVDRFATEQFNSPRFILYLDYFSQILSDPWAPIVLDESVALWFHNLFMDVDNSAGKLMMIYLIMLLIFPLLLFRREKCMINIGDWRFIYFMIMGVLCTSVPLEGLEHIAFFYLLLLALLPLEAYGKTALQRAN